MRAELCCLIASSDRVYRIRAAQLLAESIDQLNVLRSHFSLLMPPTQCLLITARSPIVAILLSQLSRTVDLNDQFVVEEKRNEKKNRRLFCQGRQQQS